MAVNQNEDALQHVGFALRSDRSFMLTVLKQDCRALQYASANQGFMHAAARTDQSALRFASAELLSYNQGGSSLRIRLGDGGTAFSTADIGKIVSIQGSRVQVDGQKRSVVWGPAVHSDCTGKIDSVDEKMLGDVRLDSGIEFENPGGMNAPKRNFRA